MTNAAHHIRVAVEGLAREIGRRVGEEARTNAETAGSMHRYPPLHDFGAALVARHAQGVLLDYLLGDFNPSKGMDT
jgi:hypothetical protein